MTLRTIFDNLEKSSDKWENYLEVYERHIQRRNIVTLVEVGVQKGGSLEMWSTYFDNACKNIIGIDVDSEVANLKYADPKIEVIIGNQSQPEFWDRFLASHKGIDIFIDDGGHFMHQQILTFEKVFPKLNMGGIYICEDTHTSYMPYNGGGYQNQYSFIEYAKTYVDVIHSGWWNELDTKMEERKKIAKDLTSVHFYDSIIVFEKLGKKEMRRVQPVRHAL